MQGKHSIPQVIIAGASEVSDLKKAGIEANIHLQVAILISSLH
jgi:hypothetical protein